MTDYLKHSGSLGPKARAELKTKLVGESVEVADEAYTVTNADKKGNTPAYQGYKAGKKNVKTGKPLYKAADHMKEDEVEEEAGCSSKKKAYKESADTQKEGPSGDTLYKVRVKNNDGRSEIRYASRAKISQLRANSNITSVEITGHGEPYNKNAGAGADAKKENEKAKKDYDGDGKVESGSKEHAGAVHNAIQQRKGGKQDGKDTRKEGFSDWRSDLEYVEEHHQKDENGNVIEHEDEEVKK